MIPIKRGHEIDAMRRAGEAAANVLNAISDLVAPGITTAEVERALPGHRLGEISAYVEAEAVSCGFSVVREFVGHGVGRQLHEEPQIPNFGKRNSGPVLKPGMTLAIEPMINLGKAKVRILSDKWTAVTADGSPSAHFEHTVLVTEGAPEVLTWPRKTLVR